MSAARRYADFHTGTGSKRLQPTSQKQRAEGPVTGCISAGAGRDKNRLITHRAEWAGITIDKEDNDPRDKDTLIKTLIDLKAACMEAEKTNRKMRDQLEKGNLVLIERGMRDQQERAQPDAQAWLFGKFAFKDKKAHTPYLTGVKSATQWASAAPSAGGQGKSPALMKLLSTDHLQFREFSRSMLLHDVQLLTRYEQKLEAETKQVKLDSVRLERQLQQLHSRVTAVSRPLSAPSARSNSAAPTSGTTRQGAGTTRQGAGSDKASLSEIARVEQECHVALELASVLKSIQRDNEAERSKRAAPPAAPFPRSPSAPGGKASGSSSLEPPQSAGGVGAEAGDALAGGTTQLEPSLEQPAASVADFAYPAHGRGAMPRLIYNVVIRTGSCRNAGTLGNVYMTLRGSLGTLPVTHLNGVLRSPSVRLIAPLIVCMRLSCTAKQSHVVDDGPVAQALVATIAKLAAVPLNLVQIDKVEWDDATDRVLVSVSLKMSKGSEQAKAVEASLNSRALIHALEAANVPSPALERAAKLSEAVFQARGSVCELEVISALGSLGHLKEVELGHDGLSSADAWFCQDVFVRPSDQVAGWTLFACHQWIKASPSSGAPGKVSLAASEEDVETVNHLARQALREASTEWRTPLVVYEISITTGAIRGSGTTSNVRADLFGSERSCLDNKLENNQADFETGTTSTFHVVSPSIGVPLQLRLSHDHSGFSPAWLVKEVEVRIKGAWGARDQDNAAGEVWSASVNSWLSKHASLQVTVPLRNASALDPGMHADDSTVGQAPSSAPSDCVPQEFRCPISGGVMRRPVVAADGYTYERDEMEARIAASLLTSPVTNQPLSDLKLVPNRILEKLLSKY